MKISFVIPTLNFAKFLPYTLDSIVDEGCPSIEIVVFDGGSTDDTLAVLDDYRAKYPELKVISATERGNIDIDLNKAVANARGEYVWTMSADDALMLGWSQFILAELARVPDLVLVPAIHCDVSMRPRRSYPILKDSAPAPLNATIASDQDLIDYLARVRTSEGLFSFCSACLVRRDRLSRVPLLERANGTCWRYSARLAAVLTDYPSKITVFNRPLIYKRGDNDSFSHAGPIRRLRIATKNWDDAISCLGVGQRVAAAMMARAKSDIRPTSLLYLSQFVTNPNEQAIFNECVQSRLGNGGPIERALARLLPRFPQLSILKRALLIARPAYRNLQQRMWNARLASTDAPTSMPGKAA